MNGRGCNNVIGGSRIAQGRSGKRREVGNGRNLPVKDSSERRGGGRGGRKEGEGKQKAVETEDKS